VSFPYDIEAPVERPPDDRNGYIEKWLSERETLCPQPPTASHTDAPLRKYTSKNRDQPLDLVGISETALRDCLPHLDVGDAFTILGTPALAGESEGDSQPSVTAELVDARQDFIDVLGGHSTLMSPPEAEAPPDSIPFAPWSLRYSGHQFGSWAGQLGDGRAISVREFWFFEWFGQVLMESVVTPHPDDPSLTYELQLKGSGRTPFSRSADGLAVLRSSIREYLCSEGNLLLLLGHKIF
jgi:hypothetical protein